METVFNELSGFAIYVGERLSKNLATAQRRIDRLVHEYESRGCFCLVNRNFNAGSDILVFKDMKLVKAIESTNYRDSSEFIKPEKWSVYMDNLSVFVAQGVEAEIVVSYVENIKPSAKMDWRAIEERRTKCEDNGIKIVVCGGQD